MKILYLHQYFITPDGGGGTRSYEMGRRFVRWGHSVNIITTDMNPGQKKGWYSVEIEGMKVHKYPLPYSNSLSYIKRILAFVRFAVASSIYAMSIDADIVFATSTPLTIAIPAILASKRNKIPMVFEVRDLWPEVPIEIGAIRNPLIIAASRFLERKAYQYSRAIIALSPGMAKGVANSGYPSERITIAPNSCDIELFEGSAEQSAEFRKLNEWLGSRPLIAYTGTLGYANNVGFLVDLAAEFLKVMPDARFLIVGDGAERTLIEEKAKRLGVYENNIFMIPSLPKKRIPEIVRAADVMVCLFKDFPSLQANSANKFFDSLAAGKPVAINYGGWQAELLQETGAGVVLSREAHIAALSLAEFLNDNARRKYASEAASRLARERFDRDKIAKIVEKILVNAAFS